MKIKVKPMFCWFDLWIGFYWDREMHILYFCPLPMCVIKITFGERKSMIATLKSTNARLYRKISGLNEENLRLRRDNVAAGFQYQKLSQRFGILQSIIVQKQIMDAKELAIRLYGSDEKGAS